MLTKKLLPIAALAGALALVAAGCSESDAGLSDAPVPTTDMADMAEGEMVEGSMAGDEMAGMEDGEHEHEMTEGREWDGLGPGEVSVEVSGDPESGWTVAASVPDFTFTVGEDHVPGQGHAHLLVDGELVSMIYEPSVMISDLEPGLHEISLTLAANDHRDYLIDGDFVGGSVMIEVPGEVVEADLVIDATYESGTVTVESGRIEASQDDLVEINLATDASEDIHVHGYDIYGKATPDGPATLRFVADVPGVFEVELEGAGVPLFDLVVS